MTKEFHIEQLMRIGGDHYRIKQNGRNVYEVKGNGLKLGSQASFRNMAGTELAYLNQASGLISPWKKFMVYKSGKLWAWAKQEDWGMLSRKEITLSISGESDYRIRGDRTSWNFDIYKGTDLVARINKEWGITDEYGVRIEDDADEVDCLLCGILIDHVYHDGSRGGAFK